MPDCPDRPALGPVDPASPTQHDVREARPRFAVGDPVGVDVRVGPFGLLPVRHDARQKQVM